MDWAIMPLRRYAEFSGRSRRLEYWSFFLLNFGLVFVIGLLAGDNYDTYNSLLGIIFLATIIPSLAVTVRRLHDTGRSGAYLLLSLVPLIGFIAFLIFMLSDSQPGPNQYGPNPKGVEALSKTFAPVGEVYKKCPYCAEKILFEAKVCRYCGRDLPAT